MSKKPAKQKLSAKNIAAGFLMAILALSLLGFGVEGFGTRTAKVATVGARDITTNEYGRALQNELRALQSQFGQPVTMEQARLFGIDRMVLEQLVTSAVLDNEADRLGISAGDTTVQREILSVNAFQGLDGRFDREAYRFALQSAGMTEREFETSIREDIARSLLQRAVISGASAPDSVVTPLLEFQAQTRDFSVTTLGAANLPEPVGLPAEAELQAFFEAGIERYTRPEGKRIHYAWITPDMMIDLIEVDDEILREAYAARVAEFSRPERRLVERLIFPDMEAARAAKSRIDSGAARFEDLVAERGLELEDTDMGDVTRAQLGAAGDAVFTLEGPGVAGPVETALGPALFRMNAVLAAQEISFEQAREQLRDEQLADLARRALSDDLDLYEDLLAGGASIRELADETDMVFGEIDWRPDTRSGIAAYEAFRDAAAALSEGDFAEILLLEDGGLFALDFVEPLPEAPFPLDEIRTQLTTDWQNARILEGLRVQADALATALREGSAAPATGASAVRFDGITRTDTLPDLPRNLVQAAFEMDTGDIRVIEGTNRVHVLYLHGIASPDLMLDEVARLRSALEAQIAQSYAQDLFGYFAAALRDATPIQLNQQIIDAVQAGF